MTFFDNHTKFLIYDLVGESGDELALDIVEHKIFEIDSEIEFLKFRINRLEEDRSRWGVLEYTINHRIEMKKEDKHTDD